MPRERVDRIFCGDFETTVYQGQQKTEVWASALVEIGTEDVLLHGSIDETYRWFEKLGENAKVFYHNLKFDGTFWIHLLEERQRLKQALIITDDQKYEGFYKRSQMPQYSYSYSISDKGQWYRITIRFKYHYLEILDSLKLIPFSVADIGKQFGTKHQKTSIKYEGFRYPNCPISEQEQEYIKNDVLVVKEALEFMFSEGHTKMTIGSCCLAEFKSGYDSIDYNTFFPDLYKDALDEKEYGSKSVGEYVLKSYVGGWCYVVPGKAGKMQKNGLTLDVNSLYPSVMLSESGSRYPVGHAKFWKGDFPKILKYADFYWFVRFRCQFEIKDGYLPFVHVRNTFRYRVNECLTTTDFIDEDGKRFKYYQDFDGTIKDTSVELTMTMIDYKLFREHYNVYNLQILDGCYFRSETGIFDEYISKYRDLKINAPNKMFRTLAKLFSNNLYGKMAANTNSSYKVCYIDEKGILRFIPVEEFNKKPGYIPCGSAITSYARNFTIRAAQKNYHGDDQPGFCYADTDSLHIAGIPVDQLIDVPLDSKAYNHWKCEGKWDRAIFTRQKTYIEHVVVDEDGENADNWEIKCAGMGKISKKLIELALQDKDITAIPKEDRRDEYREFLRKGFRITDFKEGLRVPGTLKQTRIKGGTLLMEDYYEMKEPPKRKKIKPKRRANSGKK